MKPDPEKNLIAINKSAHSVILSWDVNEHLTNFPKRIIYRLKYQSQYDKKGFDDYYWNTLDNISRLNFTKTTNKNNGSVYHFELKHLPYAHTLYDVRLQSRSEAAREDICWSDYAVVTFRTASELPERAPVTDIGSFSVLETVKNQEIYVYWQQIKPEEQNGEKFEYTVIVRENGIVKPIRANESELSYAKFVGLGKLLSLY